MDLSAFEYILPILSFLVVFIVCFFAIHKTKLIENKFISSLLSFIIAIVFVSAVGPRNYILTIIPWFAVAIVGLFLIMALSGFFTKDFPSKSIGMTFVVILALIFIISAFFVFFNYIGPYMPGAVNSVGNPGNPSILGALSWLYSPRVAGALLLIGIGAVASWILVKGK
jgi:hypothetical protein